MHAFPLTKTSRSHILHSRALTNRQVIIQAELAITIIAIPRSVFLPIPILLPIVSSPFHLFWPRLALVRRRCLYGGILGEQFFDIIALRGARAESMERSGRVRGGRVEEDDGAVGEAGAFAEGGWCCGELEG